MCVLDVESFELELRTSNGKDPKFPKTDLRLRSNKINMRTCSDSCQALFELIQYFANDGDLKARGEEEEGEEEEKRHSLDLEMMTKEEVCTKIQPSQRIVFDAVWYHIAFESLKGTEQWSIAQRYLLNNFLERIYIFL